MKLTRRDFLRTTAVVAGFPLIVPARFFGADAPSNTIQVAQIGAGRIGRSMDMPGILGCRGARYVAICDLDTKRKDSGKTFLEKSYAKRGVKGTIKTFHDYRELLTLKEVDAVSISTPDHWHSQPAVEAAFAGKDVYMQKPASLTIAEGRFVSDAIRRKQRIFLLGSQQRSSEQFHRACELVRNGRIGKISRIEIGLPFDPGGGDKKEMPVPQNLDYAFWLGATPDVYYTEDRVHSQKSISSRPGWLRCEQFGAGMITGWGSHHFDIAHWAMGWESTGPQKIEGRGIFHKPASRGGVGIWDVHGDFDVTLTYADGTQVRVWDKYPNGLRFVGEKGWVFVSRGAQKATESDPTTPGVTLKALDASDHALLAGKTTESEIHLYKHRGNHLQNWINCIRTRKETIVPAETAHRSCSACLLAHIGMKLARPLQWDPVKERFVNDAEADALLSREERTPYGTRRAFERLTA